MKILDLRDSPWVDGPGRTVLDCASSLTGTGYEVIIGTFNGGSQKTSAYAEEAVRRGLPLRVIEERSAYDWQIIGQVLRVIDDEKVELIHTHDFRSNMVGLICARRRRLPVVATVHGWIANDLKGRLYCSVDRWLLRFFDHVITVSEKTRDRVKKACPSCDRLTVVPNALRLETYVPEPRDRSFRKEFGLGEDKIVLANIGRLSPEKGQLVFLQAAEVLSRDRKDLVFLVVGVGPDLDKLEGFVRERGLQDVVLFAGFQSDMIKVYNSIDVVVQSSYTEGMPNVMLEALLMSLPVVATDVGGTAEVVEHGRTGLLIPPGSSSELVRAVAEVLTSPERSREMGQAGRRSIMARFDHNLRVRRLKGVYDSLN